MTVASSSEADAPRRPGAPGRHCVVAIPASNEADLLPDCLAALSVQRDHLGAPLDGADYSVLLLANNCTDATVAIARGLAGALPFRLDVHPVTLPEPQASAGWARKLAMDRAARTLAPHGAGGIILTTDADTRVDARWIASILAEFEAGADVVAGYVEPDPRDYVALGRGFMARGRLEDTYLRLGAEIWAVLDPRPHDPWPNHRVASGANLAVSLGAYQAVGGVPPIPAGEDAALVRALDAAGYRVRHSLDARVTTSCRLEGRAVGGAADTMRLRHQDTEADCDRDMEPARALARRAYWKGRLRRWYDGDAAFSAQGWVAQLRVAERSGASTAADVRAMPFATLWDEVEASSPLLAFGEPLRPRDLPAQIAAARALLGRLRRHPRHAGDRVDNPVPAFVEAAE